MTTKAIATLAAALALAACGSTTTSDGNTDPSDAGRAGADKPISLSKSFGLVCATCHGEKGQGTADYPALPGSTTEASFIAVVRSGNGTMPAFTPSQIADDVLKADYAWLKANQ